MSLDVYLTMPSPQHAPTGSGIFLREQGRTREVSRAEWEARFPGREPVVYRGPRDATRVWHGNLTHNLTSMAAEAGLYRPLWRPNAYGYTQARQLIDPLTYGVAQLRYDPARYQVFNPPNGWGSYEVLVEFVTEYLAACRQWPDAAVTVSR